MTEFILGSAGTGKTSLIKEKVISDLSAGKKVILLVPEQMAVNAENAICSEAERLGINQSELEILNFKRLCNRVFREYGGIAYNSVTGGAKVLVLWKALISSSPFLSYYKNSVNDVKHFIPKLAAAVNEFKQYGITPSELSKASSEAKDEDPLLSDKLHDLSIIFSSYNSCLGNEFTDPSDDLSRLCELLSEHRFFSGINVYLDSFIGFTPAELAVIKYMIKQADNFTVSLCLSEKDPSVAFENIVSTYNTLKSFASDAKTPYLITNLSKHVRFKNSALDFLSENIWKFDTENTFAGVTDCVKTVIAPDKYSETEFVAADIAKKIRDGSMYRDFAVIARRNDDYVGIIDAIFERYSLPCHVSRKIPLSEMPVFKLVISSLNICNNGWHHEDVMSFIKTGLTPVTPDKCDELESYAHRWNIKGGQWYSEDDWFMNPDGFTDRMTDKSRELLRSVNETRNLIVKPLVKFFESLDGSRTVKEVCRAAYIMLTELGTDKIVAMSGDSDKIRLWNSLCSSLDILVNTVPDIKATPSLFAGLFDLVVSQSEVGTLPSTVDEIVFGAADRIRTADVKHVYLVGVNEGVFPAVCNSDGLFSDNEKAVLEGYGLTLSPASDVTSVSELFWFYKSACSSSDTLTVCCYTSDGKSEKMKPSVAFERIVSLFPDNKTINTNELDPDFYIQNKRSSLEFSALLNGTAKGKALERIYASDSEYSGLFGSDIQPLVTENVFLDGKTSAAVFGNDLSLTQSRIDTYVRCPFSYQCKYGLKLNDNEAYRFNPRDTGNFVHKILEKFFSRMTFENGKAVIPDEAETDSIIDGILHEYISGIFGSCDDAALSPRTAQLFLRIRRNVGKIIGYMLKELEQSEFVPRFFEMRIDKSGDVAPLSIPLPDGKHAYIHGIADRVDVFTKGNDAYIRVVDYKTGPKTFSLSNIEMGLDLQMLIYLFSIWKDESGSFKRLVGTSGDIIPAGILYSPAAIGKVSVNIGASREEIDKKIGDKLKKTGLLLKDEDILRKMDKNLSGKYIPVSLEKGEFNVDAENLKTLDEMGELLISVSKTVSAIAMKMKTGDSSATPQKIADSSSCKYCNSRSICRNPKSFEYGGDKR